MTVLEPPRKLQMGDDRARFSSGAEELDQWLQRFASQNQRQDNAITYVTMLEGEVVGYYALATAGVMRELFPSDFSKGRPTMIPCILLARLAVDQRVQGRRVGRGLLQDAMHRSLLVSRTVGAAGLLVHCRDAEARRFYLSQAEFIQSPIEPMHLMLPIREIGRQFDSTDIS